MVVVAHTELLTEASDYWHAAGRHADALAAEEADHTQLNLRKESAEIKRHAKLASERLAKAAPQLNVAKLELLRATSLKLCEVALAETPELIMERFHCRRDDIASGLITLAR